MPQTRSQEHSGRAVLIALAVLLALVLGIGGCGVLRDDAPVAGQERVDSKLGEFDDRVEGRNDATTQWVSTIRGSTSDEEPSP